MTVVTADAIEWLLASREPAIRALARRDLLDEHSTDDPLEGPIVRRLLRGLNAEKNVYKKWQGAHWRLVSLAELEIPSGVRAVEIAIDRVLAWLTSAGHIRTVRVVDGLPRRCASQEGNALAVAARLGFADDDRASQIAQNLVEWQWPDGGWNCDLNASGESSSFHESCATMWGLHEYARATGSEWARAAALRTADMFLRKRLFRSPRTGRVLKAAYLELHYPAFWHFDILQGLLVLSRLGVLPDERADDALYELERKRLPNGRWRPGAYWWRPPGSAGSNVEVVNWGRRGPSEMLTLNALRVLRAAGRT